MYTCALAQKYEYKKESNMLLRTPVVLAINKNLTKAQNTCFCKL